MKKPKNKIHGGKRAGAGRKIGSKTSIEKLKPPTSTISIRHNKDVIDTVKKKYSQKGELTKLGQEWLNSLI
jgi:hypothetical protein